MISKNNDLLLPRGELAANFLFALGIAASVLVVLSQKARWMFVSGSGLGILLLQGLFLIPIVLMALRNSRRRWKLLALVLPILIAWFITDREVSLAKE